MHPVFLIFASFHFWIAPVNHFAVPQSAGGQASETVHSGKMQTSVVASNLPADLYQELRMQLLAHARLISGPRTKNPRISSNGLDHDVINALAEQRAYLQTHAFVPDAFSTSSALLPHQNTPPLPSSYINSDMLSQPRNSTLHAIAPMKASCSTPIVRSVNGKSSGAVFFPTEPDNHYRIEGCGFGANSGKVRIQPAIGSLRAAASVIPIVLQLDSANAWSDEKIDVYLASSLTGVADFPADLVVRLANGRELRLAGCLFVAARGEPQLLKTIPAAWVKLDATFASSRPIGQLEYISPPVISEEIPFDVVGSSALIVRSDPESFAVGKDTFDFSQLSPGWVVESLQLNQLDPLCSVESPSVQSSGSWSATWGLHSFSVTWARNTCASHIPPVFNFTLNSSQYAAKVWVIGPAGTQPLRNGF